MSGGSSNSILEVISKLLPEGWKAIRSSSTGKLFYFNKIT